MEKEIELLKLKIELLEKELQILKMRPVSVPYPVPHPYPVYPYTPWSQPYITCGAYSTVSTTTSPT